MFVFVTTKCCRLLKKTQLNIQQVIQDCLLVTFLCLNHENKTPSFPFIICYYYNGSC